MNNSRPPSDTLKICIVGPLPPPLGGMAIQMEKLIARLQQEGFAIISVPTNPDLPKSLSPANKIPGLRTLIRSFVFLFLLVKAMKKSQVVYFLSGFLNFFLWVTLPAIVLSKIMGKPFILNARGGGAPDFFRQYRFFLKPVMKWLALVTVPSGFLQKVFKENFNINGVIVPNIADLNQFHFKKRCPLIPSFIIARNLEPYYNVACAVRGFALIKNQYPRAILGIAGDGSLKNEIKKLVNDLNLGEAVCFHGEISHENMSELYARYDIMLNTSNVDNLPGVILEAFASGLPVVTTNAGGIPFLVEDGLSGLIIEKNDSNMLAEKCRLLLEDPMLGADLSKNGRRICNMYSWDHIRTILLPCLKTFN